MNRKVVGVETERVMGASDLERLSVGKKVITLLGDEPQVMTYEGVLFGKHAFMRLFGNFEGSAILSYRDRGEDLEFSDKGEVILKHHTFKLYTLDSPEEYHAKRALIERSTEE